MKEDLRNMKRYLAYVLAALLLLALMPTMALAETVEVDTAEKLAKAIENAKNGDTIKLTASFEVDVDGVTTNGGSLPFPAASP